MTIHEFGVRIMANIHIDRRKLSALLALVEEARYSNHLLTEDYRDRAFQCIRQIRKDLMPEEPPPGPEPKKKRKRWPTWYALFRKTDPAKRVKRLRAEVRRLMKRMNN
jgi:hypothetical protein